MPPQQIAELVSLGLTFPTVIFALYVVMHWQRSVRSFSPSTATPMQWFVLGVVIGFLGSALDNVYWSIPWSLHYIGSPHADVWMSNGVFLNIPFRQMCGTAAAYCHVRAAFSHAGIEGKGNAVLAFSLLVGVVYMLVLTWVAYPEFFE